MAVEKGHMVKVEYTLTVDGEVVDSSEKHGQPLEFAAGVGQVVPGFDAAVCSMSVDEEKEFSVSPQDGYGERDEKFVHEVPADKLPAEAKEGDTIGVGMPDGNHIPAKIVKLEADKATIDMNPPMAGKTLNFKVKLVEVGDKVEMPEQGGCCGGHGHDHGDEEEGGCCKSDDSEKKEESCSTEGGCECGEGGCGNPNCKCKADKKEE